MPNKRSRRNKTQKFYCPHCLKRLWRSGKPKHYVYYQGKSEIQKGFNLTAKKAGFLAQQNQAWVDRSIWIEEFFCTEHGKIWMHLSQSQKGQFQTRLAIREDWQRVSGKPDPDFPHCGISEFTYRMSRGQQFYGGKQ